MLPANEKGEATDRSSVKSAHRQVLMIETIPSGTILHGHYRIERVLGSGGFGHVYLGLDLNTNQQFALKEYLVTGASAQEQLQHEATVLSQLRHPNLPAFQDAFIEHGRYYVVLNYIEGHDLTDLIRMARQKNEVVPIRQIMSWILAICDAVYFLHNQRPPIIHRDIKPDNIRIMSNGTAILVDLGNAKAAADGARTLFFIRHQGTPGYAPPEQYPGGSGTDTRSDIYALAGTLYFALTAQEPYSVSTRNQHIQQGRPDLPTLQERLANNPPEADPDSNPVRQFRLGVNKPARPAPRHSRHIAQLGQMPPELLNQLNYVIHRAMAMKQRDRYPSVADFANDLRRVLAAMPQPQPPAPQPPQGPTKPIDPNSTQPDLPMLYEAIQAAKEEANKQGNPQQQAQIPSRSFQSDTSCPRCGEMLAEHSTQCANCGTSLAPVSQQSAPAASIHDAAGDQTVIVRQGSRTPSTQASPPARQSYGETPPSQRTAETSHAYRATSASAVQQQSSAQVPYQQPRQVRRTPPQQQQTISQTNTPRLPIDPKIIIFLIIAIIIIVGIAALVIINQTSSHAQLIF